MLYARGAWSYRQLTSGAIFSSIKSTHERLSTIDIGAYFVQRFHAIPVTDKTAFAAIVVDQEPLGAETCLETSVSGRASFTLFIVIVYIIACSVFTLRSDGSGSEE
jgi:hypothetical protein